jgi:hypothetical protein
MAGPARTWTSARTTRGSATAAPAPTPWAPSTAPVETVCCPAPGAAPAWVSRGLDADPSIPRAAIPLPGLQIQRSQYFIISPQNEIVIADLAAFLSVHRLFLTAVVFYCVYKDKIKIKVSKLDLK